MHTHIRQLFVFLCFVGISNQWLNADVTGIRFGQNGDTTRVVLDMDKKIEPGVFLLANPNRIVIDLPVAGWKAPDKVKTTGLISGYRHGFFNAGTYRIVLELEGSAVVKKSFYISPRGKYDHRLVFDIQSSSQAQFLKAVAESREKRRKIRIETAKANPATPIKPRSTGKRLIVIDPGHGGVDPGTLGVLGVNENVPDIGLAGTPAENIAPAGEPFADNVTNCPTSISLASILNVNNSPTDTD